MNSANTANTWDEFKHELTSKFVPVDNAHRARDKLRRLKQKTLVEKFLYEFRNTILLIDSMSEGKKIDRFVDGLKFEVKVEVLKAGPGSFEESARIVLNVDGAIWRARKAPFVYPQSGTPNPAVRRRWKSGISTEELPPALIASNEGGIWRRELV